MYYISGVCLKKAQKWLSTLPGRLVTVQRFPSPSRSIHFGDLSEANERETPRQKKTRIGALLLWNSDRCCWCCKQQEITVFETLVDICGIDFCRPALKSHQNVIHSPVNTDSTPSTSSFQLSYRSLQLLTHFQKRQRIFKVKTIP